MIDKDKEDNYIFEEFIVGEDNFKNEKDDVLDKDIEEFTAREIFIEDTDEDVSSMNFEEFTIGENNVSQSEKIKILTRSSNERNFTCGNLGTDLQRTNPFLSSHEDEISYRSKLSDFKNIKTNSFRNKATKNFDDENKLSDDNHNRSVFMVNDKSKEAFADRLRKITEEFQKELDLKENEAPKQIQLRYCREVIDKYGNIVRAIQRSRWKYDEIVKIAGLTPNTQPRKTSQVGEINSWSKFTLDDFSNKLIEITSENHVKFNLKKNEAPKQTWLEDPLIIAKYGNIRSGIRNSKWTYDEIVKTAGLISNSQPPKKSKRISRKYYSLGDFVSELKKITLLVKKELGLRNGEAPSNSQLKRLGYGGFVVVIEKSPFKWSKVVKNANLELNYQQENVYKRYNFNQFVTKLEEITDQLKESLGLREGEATTDYQLINSEFNNFYNAITKNKDFSYLDVVRASKFVRNYQNLDQDKWRNYSINDLAKFLLNITQNYRDSLNTKSGEAPTTTQIETLGFRSFVNAVRHRYKWRDVVSAAGLKINTQTSMDYYGFTIQDYADLLIKILNSGVREELGLRKNEAPTQEQLKSPHITKKFGNLPRKLKRTQTLSYWNVVKTAGLLPNYSSKNPYHHYSLDDYSIQLIEWLDEGMCEKLELELNEAPTTTELIDLGYRRYIDSFRLKKIQYHEIVFNANLIPPESDKASFVGQLMHVILEYYFLKHTRNLDCLSFHEILTSPRTSNFRIDNTIIRDNIFKELIEKRQELIDIEEIDQHLQTNIKLINFEYTISSDFGSIKAKMAKKYQGKEKLLFIVLLFADKITLARRRKDLSAQDPKITENVILVDVNQFCTFLRISTVYYEEIKNCIEIAEKAIYNEEKLKILLELYYESALFLAKFSDLYDINSDQDTFEQYYKETKDTTKKSYYVRNLDFF